MTLLTASTPRSTRRSRQATDTPPAAPSRARSKTPTRSPKTKSMTKSMIKSMTKSTKASPKDDFGALPPLALPASLLLLTAFSYYIQGGGQPPTIDWCEINNTHTSHVKEFFNCLSMLPWIISSAFGTYRAFSRSAHPWAKTAFSLSLSIAVGSYLFHAYLTRFTQALDELPMLWLGLHSTALFYKMTNVPATKPLQAHSAIILIAGSSVITLLYTLSTNYEAFLLPYAGLTVATFLFLLRNILVNKNPFMKAWGLTGFLSMLLGATLWSIELHTCRDHLKLHACWHLAVGVATYAVISYASVNLLGTKQQTFLL